MSSVKHTLTELIKRNFIEIKKKTIKRKSTKAPKRKNKAPKDTSSISAIISNILMLNEMQDEVKETEDLEQHAEEEPENEPDDTVQGGYGTIKPYAGMSPHVKYTDYDKIWGHLGAFKTNSMYGDTESSNEIAMKNGESTREMVSKETMEKAAKHFKYFITGDAPGDVGFVPPFGANINSTEWEKYRLMNMLSFYKPLMKLKFSTA